MNNRRIPLLSALALISLTSVQAATSAQPLASSQGGVMVYAVAGTGGLGGGVGYRFNDMLAVRGELAGFNYSDSTDIDGVVYDGDLKIATRALYLDISLPIISSTRFTVGLDAGRTSFGAGAVGNGGTIDIEGNTYTFTQADYLRADVKFPRVVPYLGFGWGMTGRGFNISVDVGANIGKAKVTLEASQSMLNQLGFEQDLATQLARYKDEVVSVYPIFKVSVGYTF